MPISKKIRFEIFKRDGFQCQYCGKTPPEIVLEVDHIQPRKRKGKDNEENLITACFDCNRGKGAEELKVAPPKTDERIKRLKEKQDQLNEYQKLQRKIELEIKNEIRILNINWKELSDNEYTLNEKGENDIKNLLRTFTFYDIKEAMEIAWGNSRVSHHSKFRYMCRILWGKKKQKEERDE